MVDLANIFVVGLSRDGDSEAVGARTLREAPEDFALARLSMGGYVAQEIMHQAPEWVTRMALLDTSALADTPMQRQQPSGFIEQTQEGNFKGVTSRLLPMLIHKDRLGDMEMSSKIMTMAKNIGKEAFIHQQLLIVCRKDSFDVLVCVSCPTVVICGRQDNLTPLGQHQAMTDAIFGAVLIAIEESGHLSPIEEPHVSAACASGYRYKK